MKKQAKGPKFRVGQVLYINLAYTLGGRYGRVIRIQQMKDNLEYHLLDIGWVFEGALRPLTVREAGPARGRKR